MKIGRRAQAGPFAPEPCSESEDDAGRRYDDEGDEREQVYELVQCRRLVGMLLIHDGRIGSVYIWHFADYINNLGHPDGVSIGRIRVLFVCYGNICRSPMAEFVFKRMIADEGLADRFYVASAGTSGEHIGDPPDGRAAAVLAEHGISCDGKTSRRLLRSDFVDYDYIVCMDRMNMDYLHRLGPSGHACETGRLMDYAGGGDVDDPYYDGNFEGAYMKIEKGCRGLLDHILSEHRELMPCRR